MVRGRWRNGFRGLAKTELGTFDARDPLYESFRKVARKTGQLEVDLADECIKTFIIDSNKSYLATDL